MKTSGKSAGSGTSSEMYFHADAAPVGGHLSYPKHQALPAKGSVSLGHAGGQATSRVDSFNPHPSISIGAAYSEVVSGVVGGTQNWTTVVSSTVEDLNLFDIVTADRIVAKLAIEYPRMGGYPCVSFKGSVFKNLRIRGKLVKLNLDLALLTAKPHDFPAVPWPEVTEFVERATAQSARITSRASAPQALKSRYAWMKQKKQRTQKGYIVCSLVAEVQGTATDSTFGHVIRVPGLGDLILGELIVDARSFQLNMMRAEVSGSVDLKASKDGDPAQPPAGSFSIASSRGNGSTSP